MSSDNGFSQSVRQSLDAVRDRIRGFTGLYSDEDLVREVLLACDQVMLLVAPHAQLVDARRSIEQRCRRLAHVADRFADRDLALIGTSRAQAIAAVDVLQDMVLDLHRTGTPAPRLGRLLRQRSY